MNEEMSDLPQAETADPDGVQVALRAAQTLWSRGETSESLKWLRKAAESASDEGADLRSLQLAKAAAELRAKLFGSSEPPRPSSGEISGAHPIGEHAAAQAGRSSARDAEASGSSRSSFPPAGEAFTGGEHAASHSSRPVTATQYPSHRPRQRMGLTSSVPGAPPSPRDAYGTRESAAYAAVPSWSADAERRVSAAPPPLPLVSIDDYEELEAEPDDEPGDDPGSVWSSAGESWRPPAGAADGVSEPLQPGWASAPGPSAALDSGSLPATPSAPASGLAAIGATSGVGSAAASGSSASALPPPLPPRGAFAEDEGDFGLLPDQQTVVIPPPDEPDSSGARDARWTDASDPWDRASRISGWDQDSGASWAADLRSSGWSNTPPSAVGSLIQSSLAPTSGPGLAAPGEAGDVGAAEPPPPSDTAPARLTARVHHQAVRVSFAPDLRVPGQFVVRPLREGEKAATGERVALLVALEPGVPLV